MLWKIEPSRFIRVSGESNSAADPRSITRTLGRRWNQEEIKKVSGRVGNFFENQDELRGDRKRKKEKNQKRSKKTKIYQKRLKRDNRGIKMKWNGGESEERRREK